MRLYRTGDLGYYHADGTIRFLGRRDNQIKLRGYRIELGEIETCIEKCAEVNRCVVQGVSINGSEKQLKAYIVPNGEKLDIESDNVKAEHIWKEIERQISSGMPAYMVPKQYMFIRDIPVSANGKVDRSLLPEAPVHATKPPESRRESNALELKLADIWQEVLGVNDIQNDDSFFGLGGYSISAVRIVTRINQALHTNITVGDIAENDTIEHLAAFISRAGISQERAKLIKLNHVGDGKNLILIHAIGGHVMGYHRLVRQWAPDFSVSAIRQVKFDSEITISQLATYYLQLIEQANIKPPYSLAGWSFGGIVAYEMARQLETSEGNASSVIMFDSWAPIYNDSIISETQLITGFVQNIVGSDGSDIEHWPNFDQCYLTGDFSEIKKFAESCRSDDIEFTQEQLSELYGFYKNGAQE